MSLKDMMGPPAEARLAAEFAATHFADMGARDYFTQERFAPLMAHAKSASWSDLAKEYREITGEDIRNATIAALVAQSL